MIGRFPKRTGAWALVLLASWMLITATTVAQEAESTPVSAEAMSPSFEFYPVDTGFGTFFDVTIEPGASTQISALIGNTGGEPQDLRTYAVNAYTAIGGGFAAADYGSEPNPVTSWIDYPEEIFTIKASMGVERTFTVTVPEGTLPGQYIAAVAAQHAEAQGIEGSDNFRQIVRYVIPVFITVPGEMTSDFAVRGIAIETRADVTIVESEIENTGDILVRPEGEVEVLDQDGLLLASLPVAMDSVYARDTTVLRAGVAASIGTGPFTVRVTLSDPESGVIAVAEVSDLIANVPTATPEPATIQIASSAVTPAPTPDDVQFANVEALITNGGDPVANAQLSLIASVDGAEVERFPISQSLSLPSGDTPVTTRYIPATGWTSGTWTFELLLETVEPSGAAIVVGRQAIDATITIP